ncbi:MAG: FAD-dependent monooxygenase [Micropepsaceae bacterium]
MAKTRRRESMMDRQFDIVVVGGGIGGSALAAVMAGTGKSVLLLEKSEVFEDRVRGEWLAPWGVAETKRLGLYDLLTGAGGHHIETHVTYDESRPAEESVAAPLPLGMFIPDIPGPLTIGHPHHCQTLFDAAAKAGATALRGVDVESVTPGASPSVRFRHGGETHTVAARIVVGADGRTSMVREAVAIKLHQDKPHHMFAGILIEDATGWDARTQAIGTEGEFNFLAFPQGGGRIRIYGGFPIGQQRRFTGPGGVQNFLDAFRLQCAPENRHLAEGRPAGPVLAYFNNDAWTDEPFAEGCVLIGDAAGWNDPVIGQGLSITYRDVRIVSDILKSADDWSVAAFAPYAEERTERMRRLRFAAAITSALDCEFGPEAKARRHSYDQRKAADPTLSVHGFAVMAGPEKLPPQFFTPEHRARVLGEAA